MRLLTWMLRAGLTMAVAGYRSGDRVTKKGDRQRLAQRLPAVAAVAVVIAGEAAALTAQRIDAADATSILIAMNRRDVTISSSR